MGGPRISVVRRGKRGHGAPKFLENTVILCFERRFSKQDSVIGLKPNILAPPKFWAGYATGAALSQKKKWGSLNP